MIIYNIQNLKILRKKFNLSIHEVCEISTISYPNMQKFETDTYNRKLSANTNEKLRKLFDYYKKMLNDDY